MKKGCMSGRAMILTVAAMLLVLGCGCRTGNSSGDQTDEERARAAVDKVRDDLQSVLGRDVPVLGLIIQTPSTIIFASSSASPEQAMTADTHFRFASNTKTFTSTCILRMHQDGWLDINNRITDLIPGSTIPYVPDTVEWNVPWKDEITIELLLQHAAGVYDVDNDEVPGCGGESYTAWKQGLKPDHQFSASELVGQAALHSLSYFEPGQGYHYSNTGYTMLGEIVARVYSFRTGTSKTLTDYLRDMIVGEQAPVPLDIDFPWKSTDQTIPEPFVPGTIVTEGGTLVFSRMNMSAQVAEGNGWGTLAGLNRFVRTLFRGENILEPETVELMMTDGSTAQPTYALGCEYRPNLGYGHNGCRVGYLSMMAYDPEAEVSVVVCLPFLDVSRGMDTFQHCFFALYDAAYGVREALGYPGKPEQSR
ncbi:MAG: class A beta-lactamase-related serine hydrolase [Deltaproteobacteria bacterium]|nr:class A beta-lactamase-related serine hydrolase [Deltaproteobacteria bacterium]